MKSLLVDRVSDWYGWPHTPTKETGQGQASGVQQDVHQISPFPGVVESGKWVLNDLLKAVSIVGPLRLLGAEGAYRCSYQ